jgi:hypothetical protein
MKSNVRTLSGNRIRVFFDNQEVGLLQSVRKADDYAPDAASGIGDIHVQEYVPTMARHTINVSAMVLKRKNLRTAGIFAENGDAVLKGNVFDIVVSDKDSREVMRKYIGCSYASGDTDVTKHAIVVHNGIFNCLDVTGAGT